MTHLIVVNPDVKAKSCQIDGLTLQISYHQQKILLWLLEQQQKAPLVRPSVKLLEANKVLWPEEEVEMPLDKLSASDKFARAMAEFNFGLTNVLPRVDGMERVRLMQWDNDSNCYQLSPGITLASSVSPSVDRPDKEEAD